MLLAACTVSIETPCASQGCQVYHGFEIPENGTREMSRETGQMDIGVIWSAVIPAKAGIQSVDSAFSEVCGVDSRFRGNDTRTELIPIPNDTGTTGCQSLTSGGSAIRVGGKYC